MLAYIYMLLQSIINHILIYLFVCLRQSLSERQKSPLIHLSINVTLAIDSDTWVTNSFFKSSRSYTTCHYENKDTFDKKSKMAKAPPPAPKISLQSTIIILSMFFKGKTVDAVFTCLAAIRYMIPFSNFSLTFNNHMTLDIVTHLLGFI